MSSVNLFRIGGNKIVEITGAVMELERPLQRLFEENLETLLGVRFLVTEYSITNGRIDTLGLDENNCPVIIEYKRQANENIINQGLFYLDWLMDHKADFQLLVMEKVGEGIAKKIDWSAPQLLCIAATFTKYDLHAVKQVERNIELIRYRKFGDDLFMLDLLTAKTAKAATETQITSSKTKQARSDGFANTLARADEKTKRLFRDLAYFMNGLGDDVQEIPLKYYKAFKRIKNFASVYPRKGKLKVYVKSNTVEVIEGFVRDMRGRDLHYPGNLEITIASDTDLARAKPLIQKSYEAS